MKNNNNDIFMFYALCFIHIHVPVPGLYGPDTFSPTEFMPSKNIFVRGKNNLGICGLTKALESESESESSMLRKTFFFSCPLASLPMFATWTRAMASQSTVGSVEEGD